MKRKIRFNGYYNLQCDMCGKEFYGQRSTATYCSDACKQAAYRIEKRKKEEAQKLQISLFPGVESAEPWSVILEDDPMEDMMQEHWDEHGNYPGDYYGQEEK